MSVLLALEGGVRRLYVCETACHIVDVTLEALAERFPQEEF